jgi:hypothetical protein
MFSQVYEELLISAEVDGTALTASVTATSLLPAAAKIVIPGSYIYRIGQRLRIFAAGRVSNIVTTPGTLTLDVRFGASTVIGNGGAMSLNVVAKANVPWSLWWDLTLRAKGAAANFMHQGEWVSESVIGSALPTAGGAGTAMLPNAAPAVGSNFDSTAAQTLDLFGTWSLNNANSILVHQFAAYLSN